MAYRDMTGVWGKAQERKEIKEILGTTAVHQTRVSRPKRQTLRAVGTKILTAIVSYQQTAQLGLVPVLSCTRLILTRPNETDPCPGELTSWHILNQPSPLENRREAWWEITPSLCHPAGPDSRDSPVGCPSCAGHCLQDSLMSLNIVSPQTVFYELSEKVTPNFS